MIAAECTKRRYQRILPEAEVKIQLALFKLEQKHINKLKKNEERQKRILEDEKPKAEAIPSDRSLSRSSLLDNIEAAISIIDVK